MIEHRVKSLSNKFWDFYSPKVTHTSCLLRRTALVSRDPTLSLHTILLPCHEWFLLSSNLTELCIFYISSPLSDRNFAIFSVSYLSPLFYPNTCLYDSHNFPSGRILKVHTRASNSQHIPPTSRAPPAPLSPISTTCPIFIAVPKIRVCFTWICNYCFYITNYNSYSVYEIPINSTCSSDEHDYNTSARHLFDILHRSRIWWACEVWSSVFSGT